MQCRAGGHVRLQGLLGLLGGHLLRAGTARLQGLMRFRVTSSAGLLRTQTLLGGAFVCRTDSRSCSANWHAALGKVAEHLHKRLAGGAAMLDCRTGLSASCSRGLWTYH